MNQQDNNNNNVDDAPTNVIIIPLVEEEDAPEEEDNQRRDGESDAQEEGSEESSSPPPPELQMNAEEEGWAWNLVKWMEGEDPNCNGKNQEARGKIPSDYEYALNAIVSKGNKEKADQKIRAMQQFRQKYNIQDTVEEGVKTFEEYIQLQPGHLLHIDDLPGSKGSLVAVDYSKWFPSRFAGSTDDYRVCVVAGYYLFQICTPNFDALRGGTRVLLETTGMSLRNMDARLQQQMHDELFFTAPVNWTEFRFYNTSNLATTFVDMLRKFLPPEVNEVISVGCQVEAVQQITDPTGSPALNRILNAIRPNPIQLILPQVFLQPNYDTAMKNLMTKVRTLLEERYRNEETFELFSQATRSPQQFGTPPGQEEVEN